MKILFIIIFICLILCFCFKTFLRKILLGEVGSAYEKRDLVLNYLTLLILLIGTVSAVWIGMKQNSINNNLLNLTQKQEEEKLLEGKRDLRNSIRQIVDELPYCDDGIGSIKYGPSCMQNMNYDESLKIIGKIDELLNSQYGNPLFANDEISKQNWFTATAYFGEYTGPMGAYSYKNDPSSISTLETAEHCIYLVYDRLNLNGFATTTEEINQSLNQLCGK